jgi:hypothetical protein
MGKEITKLLKEATQGILTDETLNQIQEAFDSAVDEKVKIHVEKALTEQDAEYTEKAQQLLEAIDKDHSAKLTKVVEAQDLNNAAKLQSVISKYQKVVGEQANQFKSELVGKISDYIDVFIESKIPAKAIKEAVQNQKARQILNNLRESLAIDSALMSKSLRDALLDGKTQIVESKKAAEQALTEASKLRDTLGKAKAALVLEQKTSKLSAKKKEYAQRVFEGKSPKFIIENIDYTLSLFDKKEEERLQTLKEEAFSQRKIQEDRVVIEEDTEILNENNENSEENFGHVSNYLNELSKY